MGFSIAGLGSGIDTASLVTQLMQAERVPQTKITARQQAAQKQVASWNDLRTKMQALQTAAAALSTPAKALGSTTSTSDADVVTAVARPEATPGSYGVTVDQLAVAQQQKRSGLGPLSMTVGAGRTSVVAGPAWAALDLDDAEPGAHTVQVTRASSAATLYGTPALALPPDLTLSVDGGPPVALTLRSTHTDDADLLADLNSRLGPAATASIVGGRLRISAASEGSTHSLQLGGAAATALGLPPETARGEAALLLVDGTSQTVEPQEAGAGTRLQTLGETGMLLTVGAGLALGTTRGTVAVTDADSTLADLQAMLNDTGSPVAAAVVAEDAGSTLVLSSTATGTDGALHIRSETPVLRGLTETQAAKNAVVTVAGLTVTRSSNTLTDVVPGVTLDLLHKPTDGLSRTVTVARDSSGTVDRVKALVDALNTLVGKVATETKYDVKSKTGGPLVGDSTARALASTLFSKASSVVGTAGFRSLSALGIQTTRDGRFEVKTDVLTKALATDPDAAAKVLAEFSTSVEQYAKTSSETGGLMTSRRDGAQADVDARQKQFDAMEVRLAATERRYKAQYSALETAMASLNSQTSAMSAALSGMNSSS
ncbi:MAG: flagellar hook-associated 2 domain protein [Frankiales bacterium]|nr:flagellar hook-associated 2 domain protein [Frankiales bacterium]